MPHYGENQMFHWHKWIVITAKHRDEPVPDELTRYTGKFIDGVARPKTDILYRCDCGQVKSESIHGKWEIDDLLGCKQKEIAALEKMFD
jgi:hypothetical protein